jgi:beta-glucosidase
MHANKELLNDTLRGAWGVTRALVESDGGDCIGALVDFRVAANRTSAAVLSVQHGMDMDLAAVTLPTLVQAFKDGMIAMADIDRAAADVLTQKFAGGLFDQPYTNSSFLNASTLDPPASRALALQAAQQSIALLVNANATLPLALAGRRVVMLGSLADSADALKGGYAQDGQAIVTVLQAFQSALGAGAVTYAVGADPDARAANASRIAAGVAAAAVADVVVLVLGDSLGTCGEMVDRSSFDLPGAEQKALLSGVLEAVPPTTAVVLVLVHARPMTFGGAGGDDLLQGVHALLAAYRPGEEGGTAVFDVVSGRVNPSGKLMQAWPRSVGQVYGPASPYMYPFQGNHMFENYWDGSSSPLFPFGTGLSYTGFALSSMAAVRRADGGFDVSVTVTNEAGPRGVSVDGSTAVLLFAEDVVCSIVRVASVQLVGFDKVWLAAGDSAVVSLVAPAEWLSVWRPDGGAGGGPGWILEPGDFKLTAALAGPGYNSAFPAGSQQVVVTV